MITGCFFHLISQTGSWISTGNIMTRRTLLMRLGAPKYTTITYITRQHFFLLIREYLYIKHCINRFGGVADDNEEAYMLSICSTLPRFLFAPPAADLSMIIVARSQKSRNRCGSWKYAIVFRRMVTGYAMELDGCLL